MNFDASSFQVALESQIVNTEEKLHQHLSDHVCVPQRVAGPMTPLQGSSIIYRTPEAY